MPVSAYRLVCLYWLISFKTKFCKVDTALGVISSAWMSARNLQLISSVLVESSGRIRLTSSINSESSKTA